MKRIFWPLRRPRTKLRTTSTTSFGRLRYNRRSGWTRMRPRSGATFSRTFSRYVCLCVCWCVCVCVRFEASRSTVPALVESRAFSTISRNAAGFLSKRTGFRTAFRRAKAGSLRFYFRDVIESRRRRRFFFSPSNRCTVDRCRCRDAEGFSPRCFERTS